MMHVPSVPPPVSLLDAALAYAARGWAVFPLHSAPEGRCTCGAAQCARAAKHPRTQHGLKDATTDEATIRGWWSTWPDANVAIATGSVFVVVDIDGAEGEKRLAELLSGREALPLSPVAHTGGGGRHVLFASPEGSLKNSNSKIARKIDVRGDGGYIVAPPSLHASGQRYRWAEGAGPDVALPSMPAWLLERARGGLRAVAPPPIPAAPPSTDITRRASAYLAKMDPAISGQGGHGAAFEAACALVKGFALSPAEALSMFAREYNPRCEPPWGQREMEHKIASAEKADRPLGYLRDVARPGPYVAPPPRRRIVAEGDEDIEREAIVGKDEAAPETAPRPLLRVAVTPGNTAFSRGDQKELADVTLRALGPNPLTHDAGEFWRYAPDRGIWEQLPGHLVRSTAASFAGCPVGADQKPLKVQANTTSGAEALARDQLLSRPGAVSFGEASTGIAFANGFVTVRAGLVTVLPHAPEHRARHAYPFAYQEAPHPLLDRFLAELFADVSPAEASARVALLQEFIGACLVGEAPRYQRYLILFATGGNGKSELLRIARGIFPPDAVTSLPPQRWADQFKAIMLEGKRANFCDELPDGEIMSGEAVKLVVTGEPIPGERKHKDAIVFRPVAGHIFATNSPIRSADQSEGFWRRPLVLPLTRRFDEAPSRALEAGQAVLDAELPAVVAWALRGAARAQLQRGYTLPDSALATVREWRDESDQVRAFAIEKPIAGRMSATDLYKSYTSWARDNGVKVMSSTMFGRRLMAAEIADREILMGRRFYVPKRVKAGAAAAG